MIIYGYIWSIYKQFTTKNILVKRRPLHSCHRVRDSKDGVAGNLSWEMHGSKVQGLSRAEKQL